MPKDDLHFRLRIPADLKSQVKVAAAHNDRSMTAEIISRLRETFEDDRIVRSAGVADINSKLDRILDIIDPQAK